jgi:glucose-6-phosphate 1-dehydrogenase
MPDQTKQVPRLDETRVKPPGPCAMVIFGATGDLTKRLLVPALYNLAVAKLLPDRFAVLGVSGSDITSEELRRRLTEAVRTFTAGKEGSEGGADRLDRDAWDWLIRRISYLPGDLEDPQTYRGIQDKLADIDREFGTRCNTLFYLATPGGLFGTIVHRLGEAGLTAESERCWRRVVIEKPFGNDLPSARELNRQILSVLKEEQIFRIDHFLGKETVQNIMVLRFGNGFFEPIWNRDHIDHVQITVAETVGVEQRGRFYDVTGALRDMVPNHVFQLLAMTAMAPPNSFAADAVRTEKAKVLDAVHRFTTEDVLLNVVRGQYGAGTVHGRTVKPYRQEPNVAPDSGTETYVAMKLMIENWRWAGVPFYLRTGKSMSKRWTEIAIRFKQAPLALFRDTPVEKLAPNWLVLRIQPDEGISLEFGAKLPGPTVRIAPVDMEFRYADHFAAAPSTGYETLIYDSMIGDATLFQRADNIEEGWAVVQPILDAWRSGAAPKPAIYPAGSDGPEEANALLARDGRRWRAIG